MIDLLTTTNIFLFMLASWLVGALGSLIFCKNDSLAKKWGSSFAILGSIAGIICSYLVLVQNSVFSFYIYSSFPLLSFSFFIDKLSAFFIFIISLIALFSSIYSFGYVKHFYKKYNIGYLGFFYNIFLAGMVMVASAHNLLFFLIVWEIMSLSSYFLVIFENKEKENIKAGSLYFIMTHIGTAFIIVSFLLLYKGTGSMDFSIIKNNIGMISPFIRNIIFILSIIGFGTKAGIIPLHIWLPSAHPAAPSHVSSLMSGVMIKTGIYMIIRIFIGIMPIPPVWWGVVIIILGSISSLFGVLYALTEHDIKKLLAYHSIENIGIILIGLGSSMVFWSLNIMPLAILGLIASLFHTLNHAVFKSLLFLGAGSVVSETGTRNMEEYGGLIKYMPQTALFFLVGSMAISALPPFNGFFSEWMTFQSLFAGIGALSVSARWAFVFGAGSLVFTGGLAVMCFVKVFGSIFLARPRSEKIKEAKESSLSLHIGMGCLAFLTLFIGFFASKISNIISGVVKNLGSFSFSEMPFSASNFSIRMSDGFSSLSMPLILISLVLVFLVSYIIFSIITRNNKVKTGTTWDCGTTLTSRMEITATGFSRSIISIFSGILKPTKQIDVKYQDENIKYFQKSKTVELGVRNIYQIYFYRPIKIFFIRISDKVKKVQGGNINAYILYIFLMLLLVLFISIM